MYSALTDLICIASVFVLAAFLFAVSVVIVMMIEGLKLLRQVGPAAAAVMSRSVASLARRALALRNEKEPGGLLSNHESVQWTFQQ
jgi:hypothetical protein